MASEEIAAVDQPSEGTTTETTENLAKVFALMDPSDTASNFNNYLTKSTIDGIAIRLGWKDLETSDDTYNWSKIDEAFSSAKTYNKKVGLHILATDYSAPPNWVYTSSTPATKYYYTWNGQTKSNPVPWDNVFLQKWNEFISSGLKPYLESKNYLNYLEYISIAVPTPEMSLVSCANNILAAPSTNSANTTTIYYNRANYLNAWKSTLTNVNSNFPNHFKLISAPVDTICYPDSDGADFFADVYNEALSQGANFGIFAADLQGTGSSRLDNISQLLDKSKNATQFVCSHTATTSCPTFQGSLKDSVCKGISSYGSKYFEFYKSDIDSSNSDEISALAATRDPSICD